MEGAFTYTSAILILTDAEIADIQDALEGPPDEEKEPLQWGTHHIVDDVDPETHEPVDPFWCVSWKDANGFNHHMDECTTIIILEPV